ncbi:MAG: hypothetical protein V1921_06530 [Candidatus Altiarchaeota archaeon]
MTGTKIVKLNLDGAADKLPSLKSDPVVEEALRLYEASVFDGHVSVYRREMVDHGSKLDVSQKQLQHIVDVLEETQPEGEYLSKGGVFLTALIQASRQDDFQLRTKRKLNFVGCSLTEGKRITVYGDLGNNTGMHMAGGKLHILGSVGNVTGYGMEDGEITVGGNAADGTGVGMKKGKIRIEGDVGNETGDQMGGGEIEVLGKAGDRTGVRMTGGKIRVEKDAGDETGRSMSWGAIHVRGDIGDDTGYDMTDGLIRVDGNAGEHTGQISRGGTVQVRGEIKSKAENRMCAIQQGDEIR